jgi:CheY-like chemotaxis protein
MDQPPSILVVDDEADRCLNLADFLGEFGDKVDMAGDGAEAMDLLERRTDEIALLDPAMLGLDGLALSRRIAGARPDLRTCFITAHTGGTLAKDVRACPAGPVLAKPRDARLMYWVDGAVGQRKCTGAICAEGGHIRRTEDRCGRPGHPAARETSTWHRPSAGSGDGGSTTASSRDTKGPTIAGRTTMRLLARAMRQAISRAAIDARKARRMEDDGEVRPCGD